MPIRGKNPMGPEFFELFREWGANGKPSYESLSAQRNAEREDPAASPKRPPILPMAEKTRGTARGGAAPPGVRRHRGRHWDQSAARAYRGRPGWALGEEVFVSDRSGALDVVELLIRYEIESYRNELTGNAKNQEGLSLEIPALIEARVAMLRAKLEAELEPVDTVDFLVPYELHERTVMQGVLGRRGRAKESFVQCFRTEDLRRRYDETRTNLRDRGLKIRGSRLELSEARLAAAINSGQADTSRRPARGQAASGSTRSAGDHADRRGGARARLRSEAHGPHACMRRRPRTT
jgi:hypothetical protein